jgi:lipopolysaccharide transport system permease protein|tara:strand:- start:2951 stop:3802 length:852 start_codon:yes stop_codon:yes gene_type:complete
MSDEQFQLKLKKVGERNPSWKAPILNISTVFKYRFLVRNLVRREIRGKYRNAMLGYTWTVLEPILLASVYYFLFVMLAGNPDEMYPIWVLLGVIIWGCFGRSLSGSVSSLSRNAQTIHLVYFPRIIFPITSIFGNIVISMMSCLVVIPIMIVYGLPITVHLALIPLSVFFAGFLGIGLGMLVAPLNCMQRDVEHLFRFIVRAGFFLSPVMWTYEMALERGVFGEVVLFNPMVVPLTMARHGIAGESLGLPWIGVFGSLGFGIFMWIIGSYVFNRYEAGAVKHL